VTTATHAAAHPPEASRRRWTRFAAPMAFYRLAGQLLPTLAVAAGLFGLAGLVVGFFVAPTDATQGESYRILYLHVPAAWMAMLLYAAMAFWAAVGWVFNARMASMLARAIAPTGALFTALCLVSGALWGRPTWGTYWVWDARLTSALILLFLYVGFMALVSSIDDPRRGDRAGALLAIIGVVNLPIIYFSVVWWNTLHQGASITLTAAPTLAGSMLLGLALTTVACWLYAMAVTLQRCRALILEREAAHHWVLQALDDGANAMPGDLSRVASREPA
jgi:heme exporter protein C